MTDPNGPVTELTEIVVNGRRISYTYAVPDYLLPRDPLPPGEADELPDPGTGAEPPPCQNTSNMTDEEKLEALVKFALAVWRNEVAQNPTQNREWGAAFFIDANGELGVTSLVPSTDQTAQIDWNDLPRLPTGDPDFSRVVAIVHTHPRYNIGASGPNTDYYDPSDPARLLRPSLPHTDWAGVPRGGDWATFDYVGTMVDYQRTHLNGPGPTFDVSLAIVGFDGAELAINVYPAADHGYGSLNAGGGANDGIPGSRGSQSTTPLPPCSD